MKHPGVWILGDLADDDRKHGMGIVVEYAGQKGKPHKDDYRLTALGDRVFAEEEQAVRSLDDDDDRLSKVRIQLRCAVEYGDPDHEPLGCPQLRFFGPGDGIKPAITRRDSGRNG